MLIIKKYLCLLFFIVLPLCLQAQEIKKKVYTIGVQSFKYYLPYSQFSKGHYSGFNKELLDMFAKSKNYTFIYKAYPLKRLYKTFLEQELDFKYPDNPYWNAKLKVNLNIVYSDVVVESLDGVMVLPKNKNKNISNLKKLGVLAAFTPYPYLKDIKENKIKTYEIYDYRNMLTKALKNKVDGVYSNIMVSRYYLKNIMHKENQLVFDESLPYIKNERFFSTIKYPHIIKEFNQFLKENTKNIDILKKQYNIDNISSAFQ